MGRCREVGPPAVLARARSRVGAGGWAGEHHVRPSAAERPATDKGIRHHASLSENGNSRVIAAASLEGRRHLHRRRLRPWALGGGGCR